MRLLSLLIFLAIYHLTVAASFSKMMEQMMKDIHTAEVKRLQQYRELDALIRDS